MNGSILIMLHCEQNTGYAIKSLEAVFKAAALEAGYSPDNILWSYCKINSPQNFVYELDYYQGQDAELLSQLIHEKQITSILAFDLPYPTPIARAAKASGVKQIISYWGASMSSLNTGLKLAFKRSQWIFQAKAAPDRFIFESEAMRETATHGRGVPNSKTNVIPLGVDTSKYSPSKLKEYAYQTFNIPLNRKIVFFSGHMEERKGVKVLVQAMLELEKRNKLDNFHLLICGNRDQESQLYEAMVRENKTKDHVTFAGYRDDIPELMSSSFIGTIASTGWDSFTMSSVEMLSSGLPLIVSELQGLKETIVSGECGFYIPPGDFKTLADLWEKYEEDKALHQRHSVNARIRAIDHFSQERQIKRLSQVLNNEVLVTPIDQREITDQP